MTTLYDSHKKAEIAAIGDLSAAVIADYCDAHSVHFIAQGTPPTTAHPDGWDTPGVFRVATHDFPARGHTISVQDVLEWRRDRVKLSEDVQARFDNLTEAIAAIAAIGKANPGMDLMLLEQCITRTWSAQNSLKQLALTHEFESVIERIPEHLRLGSIIELAIAGARSFDYDYERSMALEGLLRAALLTTPVQRRLPYFETEHVQAILAMAPTSEPSPV